MKIIEQIDIKKFRGFEDVSVKFNKPVNAIIGKNGSMKTTLLGMLAHPFTLKTVPYTQRHKKKWLNLCMILHKNMICNIFLQHIQCL